MTPTGMMPAFTPIAGIESRPSSPSVAGAGRRLLGTRPRGCGHQHRRGHQHAHQHLAHAPHSLDTPRSPHADEPLARLGRYARRIVNGSIFDQCGASLRGAVGVRAPEAGPSVPPVRHRSKLPAGRIHLTPQSPAGGPIAGPRLRLCTPLPRSSSSCRCSRSSSRSPSPSRRWPCWSRPYDDAGRDPQRGSRRPGAATTRRVARVTMLKETFLHTRMLQWTWIGVMHWFVYAAFLFLSTAVLAAYFQLFEPDFAWPLIGHWYPYEWFMRADRPAQHGRHRLPDRRTGSTTTPAARAAEPLLRLELLAGLLRRGARSARGRRDPLRPRRGVEARRGRRRSHYPISSWLGDAFYPSSVERAREPRSTSSRCSRSRWR